jgi:ABC-type glycerol-3-phosphate transport system substrate-binding protein|tara:strand:+ start:1021 stop:1266 length:246 start_codon:yes stop_codon:yes gene_type:complete
MRIATLTIASLLTLSTAHQAMAEDSVSIEPRLWEVSTTMTTPMSPEPRVETQQECIKDSKISPQDLAPSDNGECLMSVAIL